MYQTSVFDMMPGIGNLKNVYQAGQDWVKTAEDIENGDMAKAQADSASGVVHTAKSVPVLGNALSVVDFAGRRMSDDWRNLDDVAKDWMYGDGLDDLRKP
jgi:hypothetical protein